MSLMDRNYVRKAPRWHAGEGRLDPVRGPRREYEQAVGMTKGPW